MLNRGSLQPQARNPRALLKINDTVIRKIDSIEYIENNYYQPDAFRCTLPLYNLDDAINIEYWLSQPAILVEILIGFPNDPINYGLTDLQSMIIGGINDLEIKPFDNGGGFVVFNGFDLSKSLIDNKTTEKFQNQLTSDIAITLAKRRGLTPVVTPTKVTAGYYYTRDYVQLGNQTTEWDLLTYLAQKDGYQLFVRGKNLYYQPRVTQTDTPYVLSATTPERGAAMFDGTRLTLLRNFNYARDVSVTVSSWNAKDGYVTSTANTSRNNRKTALPVASGIAYPQKFSYVIPGLSKQQSIERAQQLIADISIHERVIDFTRPGDNVLRKDSVIQLKGISVSADQTYYPDTITRFIDSGSGSYTMSVRAKNHSPLSIITI